ncbi:MAG: hypothetical protein EXR72_11460 [Myxococcales bacterium]|nr:hypothetical protein [Myxococcales bacterium]
MTAKGATDDARLGELAAELAGKASYATGARPFPRPVGDEECSALAAALAAQVDLGTAARARVASESGFTIACREGCNACCEVMVMVYRPEALAIARFLDRPENAAARAAFLAAYRPWRVAVGDAPERLTDRFVAGDPVGYDALHLLQFRRRVLCAFNHEGRCTIYPVRPLGCRNALALDTHELCAADHPSGRAPAALAFVPLDRFMQSATKVLRAAHNANRPSEERHRQESVCVAVHRITGD